MTKICLNGLILVVFWCKFQACFSRSFLETSRHHSLQNKHEDWMDKSLPLAHSTHDLSHIKKKRHLTALNAELTPLFPGYGTHFAYVYVGTPPQRQSVIIDTGSHYTAFPCTGCSQCGQHTDNYWNLKNSSTAIIPKCVNNQPCVISQSYTEGSSWHAYKVTDKLWVGNTGASLIPGADNYNVNFTFGCQTTETGLFRTQLADGIMGMSISDDTLPNQLKTQGVVGNRIFALCFRTGGGIMTLGGVDQRIHTKKAISYVKLDSKSNGWFGVVVQDIILESAEVTKVAGTGVSPTRINLGVDKGKYATGKGTIVDSGTTDTYLPVDVAAKFSEIFKKISGTAFSGGNIKLSADQLSKLPTIVYVLEGLDGQPSVEVSMPWSSYVDSVGDGKYSFRVYLTEKTGAVLGANFMNNYNIIFDSEGKRVGFAESLCDFEEFVPVVTKNARAGSGTKQLAAVVTGLISLVLVVVGVSFWIYRKRQQVPPGSLLAHSTSSSSSLPVRPPSSNDRHIAYAWVKFKSFASRRGVALSHSNGNESTVSRGRNEGNLEGHYELVCAEDVVLPSEEA